MMREIWKKVRFGFRFKWLGVYTPGKDRMDIFW